MSKKLSLGLYDSHAHLLYSPGCSPIAVTEIITGPLILLCCQFYWLSITHTLCVVVHKWSSGHLPSALDTYKEPLIGHWADWKPLLLWHFAQNRPWPRLNMSASLSFCCTIWRSIIRPPQHGKWLLVKCSLLSKWRRMYPASVKNYSP